MYFNVSSIRSERGVDMAETTCKCSECYYHRTIDNVRTCGLQHKFLDSNVVGCYGGYKQRNEEAERALAERRG